VTFGHYGCCTTSSCACAHPREPRRGKISVTSGSHVTTTKKKARGKMGHAQNLLPVRDTSGQCLFQSRDFVTSGQKAPTKADIAQNILPDRTGHVTDVTSGHIISGCSSSLLLKCGFVRADILLIIPTYIRMLSFDWLIKGIFFFNNSQFFQFLPHHRLRGHANFPRCSGNLLHLSFSQIILANRIYLYIILTCSISVNDIYKYGIL
jgi:hypothetical protein